MEANKKGNLFEKLEYLKQHKDSYEIYIDRDIVTAAPLYDEDTDGPVNPELESVYLGNTADDILADIFRQMGLKVGYV